MEKPPKHTTLPAFTPVPREKARSNGWKPEVQRAFIEALAETGSVKAACARVNRADHGAYMLRRHPEAESFRQAWQAALDLGLQRIEDVAMDRALNGVEVPVYSYGKLVGTRTVYNDRLLMFMLRNRAPERFTEGRAKALNAVDTQQLARLKQQWRKEWEAEQQARLATGNKDVLKQIDDKLEKMRQRRLKAMSPRTRAAMEHYEQCMRDDKQGRYRWYEDPEHPDYRPRAVPEQPEAPALPPPDWRKAEGAPQDTGPRIRGMKDDGW